MGKDVVNGRMQSEEKRMKFAVMLVWAGVLTWAPITQGQVVEKLLDATEQSTESFPDAWTGEWSGELQIYRGPRVVRTIKAEMSIQKLDDQSGYEWTTRYLDGKGSAKKYKLLVLDRAKGHYQVDEGPIKLDAFYSDGALRSWFQAGQSMIFSRYEMRSKQLTMELVSSTKKVNETGTDPETGMHVESFPINGFQKLVLQRKSQ